MFEPRYQPLAAINSLAFWTDSKFPINMNITSMCDTAYLSFTLISRNEKPGLTKNSKYVGSIRQLFLTWPISLNNLTEKFEFRAQLGRIKACVGLKVAKTFWSGRLAQKKRLYLDSAHSKSRLFEIFIFADLWVACPLDTVYACPFSSRSNTYCIVLRTQRWS